jgi:type II secretory pathway component PulL
MRFTKSALLLMIAACVMPSVAGAETLLQAKLSPEANAYMQYRKEVPKAKRLEDLYFHFDQKSVEYYRSLNAAERTKIFQQLKAQVDLFPQLTVTKEDRGLGVATVVFNAKSADNKEAVLTVEIVREGAALKVGQANWKIPE